MGEKGFTLIELLITFTVAAIFAAIAIPSYRSLVQKNSLAAATNDLVGALNHARSQAVSAGTTVCICASDDQLGCNADGDWRPGWIIYRGSTGGACPTNPTYNAVIQVHSSFGPEFRMESDDNTPISFNSNGFAMFGRTIYAGYVDRPRMRKITVASTGRVRAQDNTSGGRNATNR